MIVKCNKIIILILICCLVVSGGTYAKTTGNNEDSLDVYSITSEILASIKDNLNEYGISQDVDLNDLYLSDAIKPYIFQDKEFKQIDNTNYYFVIYNTLPIANVTVFNDFNGNQTTNFDTYVAKEIEKHLLRGFDEFIILHDDGKIKLISNTDVNTKIKVDKLSIDQNITINQTSIKSNYNINLVTQYPAGYEIKDIAFKLQGNYNLCWAASVACIAQKITGVNKSAMQVADALGVPYDSGAYTNQSVLAYSGIYGKNATSGSRLTNNSALDLLVSDIPIQAIFAPDNSTKAHSVVIKGYGSSSQGIYFKIMDPNFEYTKVVYAGVDSAGKGTYVLNGYGSGPYYWQESIFIY